MDHRVVSREAWLKARRALLAREKDFTHLRDALGAARRDLPWVKIDKSYVFDGPTGRVAFADLFDGRSQLLVYHFMFGPDWEQGCPSCSYLVDHVGGALVHLAQRDVSYVAVSRAPWAKIAPFKTRMGWTFNWVSSNANDFNRDFHVSFTKAELARGKVDYNFAKTEFPIDEAHGLSVFYKSAAGEIFHTYSTYARGCDLLVGTYNYLDLVPKGRDEDALGFTMAWVRHHDRYAGDGRTQPVKAAASCCAHEMKA